MRVAAGSGLRADVWREFARRFGKINVREAYGLTEASIGFVNYTNEIGPIGRAGYFNKVRHGSLCFVVNWDWLSYPNDKTRRPALLDEELLQRVRLSSSCNSFL